MIDTENTNMQGEYGFSGLAPGRYQIEATAPQGQVSTNANPQEVELTSAETENADFGFNSNKMASIGDTIFEDLNGNGSQEIGEGVLPDVEVKLYEDTAGGTPGARVLVSNLLIASSLGSTVVSRYP